MVIMNKVYLIKKILYAFVTLFAVVIINYFLFRVMPGDPVAMLVRNPSVSPETVRNIREMFGLDQPWYIQFFIYLKNLFTGNMGISFIYKKEVVTVIAERLVATVLLTFIAEIIAIVFGLFLGIVAAWNRGKKIDVIALGFALVTYAMPTFWLGVILIAFFSGYLNLFPTSGMVSPSFVFVQGFERIKDIAWHIVLPALTLALVLLGEYMLVMRSTLIDVLTEDYIVTAEAKGLTSKQILKKHALPNAMIPMVTIIALNLGFAITGALQVETVFSWPGIGRLMYDALQARDYPLLQGIFLVTSLAVIGANLISDLLYGYLDPRVKN